MVCLRSWIFNYFFKLDCVNVCMVNNFFYLVVKGRFGKVKLILDGGYKINSRNNYGYSVFVGVFYIDCDEKCGKMFCYLLLRNVDLKDKDFKYNWFVFFWVVILGWVE